MVHRQIVLPCLPASTLSFDVELVVYNLGGGVLSDCKATMFYDTNSQI